MTPTGPAAAGSERWHALGSSSVLATLETSEQGLSDAEAEERRRRFGPNRLVRAAPSPVLRILLRQFQSVVVLLLVVALLIALLLGEALEAGAIGAVLVINALIGNCIAIDHLNEFPFSPYNCFEGLEEREPGRYYLRDTEPMVPLLFSVQGTKKA